MNPTRWAFLYHGMQRHEVQAMEIQQVTLARALGLGAIPVRDRENNKLRIPTKFSEMQPLLFAISQPAYAGHLAKLWEEMDKQETIGPIDDEPIILDDDTGIEILDKPLETAVATEAERRQVFGPPTQKPPKFVLDK